MKIVFTSSYETFSKENTKNYIPNSYVLFLIIWDGKSIRVCLLHVITILIGCCKRLYAVEGCIYICVDRDQFYIALQKTT